LIAFIAVAMMFLPRHQVGAQRFDVDRIERINPNQEIVLDRRRRRGARGPMAERSFALSRQRIDQLVGFAGLDDLAPLNMAALAQLGELAIDLLMVGLPEKADR